MTTAVDRISTPSARSYGLGRIDDLGARSFERDSGLIFEQGDATLPTPLLSAHAPGDHGIGVLNCRFARGLKVGGTSLHHMIFLSLSSEGETVCRIDDKVLSHVVPDGNLTVCPAGAEVSADSAGDCESLILLIPGDTLSFAAAERSRPGASLVKRLRGEDPTLLRLGFALMQQVSDEFVDGPLAWSELSHAIVARLIDRHLSAAPMPSRGRIEGKALARVIDCIHANIDRSLSIDELADAAGQSRSHFPRVFRRSVGCSPYQYVIRVRLERAFAFLRAGERSLAEVAIRCGFADQSHLTRWMRRSYGATPAEVAGRLVRGKIAGDLNRDPG
jgi:AraC family transcriptional regulator